MTPHPGPCTHRCNEGRHCTCCTNTAPTSHPFAPGAIQTGTELGPPLSPKRWLKALMQDLVVLAVVLALFACIAFTAGALFSHLSRALAQPA